MNILRTQTNRSPFEVIGLPANFGKLFSINLLFNDTNRKQKWLALFFFFIKKKKKKSFAH